MFGVWFGLVSWSGFFFVWVGSPPPFFLFPPFLLNLLIVISEVRAGRAEGWKFNGGFLDGFFNPVGPTFMSCA